MQPLPAQAMAATEQMATDFGESAQNILVVVISDEQGLRPADDQTYRALADKLRGDARTSRRCRTSSVLRRCAS